MNNLTNPREFRVGDPVVLPQGGENGKDVEGQIISLDGTIALVEWHDGYCNSHVRVTSLRRTA